MALKFQPRRNGIPAEGGFNMLELLISISVAAILLVLAMPSLRSISATNQAAAANNAIVTGLNMARASAITSGNSVSICPSADGAACAANSWHQGWIVFNDVNADGAAATTEITRVMSMRSGASQSGFGGTIVFLADGTTNLASEETITSCFTDSQGPDSCLDVVVSAFGKIKSVKHEETEEDPPSS